MSENRGAFGDLAGVPLLPLEDRTVTEFKCMQNSVQDIRFLLMKHDDEERMLFSNAGQLLVSHEVPRDVREVLAQGEAHGLNLTWLTARRLPRLLRACYPTIGMYSV